MRPFIYITVGYITGIIWGLYLKVSIVPVFLIFGGIAYFILKNRKKKVLVPLLLFIIFSIISNIQINNLEKKHDNLYKNIEDVKIVGTIISEKRETEYKASYTIKVETINNNTKFENTKLLIYIPKNVMLDYGDKAVLDGSYEKAKEATNYKGFNYREYLKQKDIYGIAKVENVEIIKKDNLNKIQLNINKIRNKIKSNLKQILGEEANVTIGILLRRYFGNSRRNNR